MKRLRCAYLTMENPGDSVTDFDVSHASMAALSWDVDMVPWCDVSVDWNVYDAVYICTPWDYPQRAADFIDALERIDCSSATLINNLALVKWSLEKTYLRDLQDRGAGIVPSSWYKDFDVRDVPAFFQQHDSDKVVVKPVVGANAVDTFVLNDPVTDELVETLQRTFAGRSFLVQPFINTIQHDGEYSLFFFAGAYSHAILKKPASGDFRVQEEHGADILSVEPPTELVAIAREVISVVDPQPVYARGDFVRDKDGRFLLMELELIEPSLYLRTDKGAAMRFAHAIDSHVRRS